MPCILLQLLDKRDIVLFHYLYSQHSHLGWPRSLKDKKNQIMIYTSKDLMIKNQKILKRISKIVDLDILSLSMRDTKIILD